MTTMWVGPNGISDSAGVLKDCARYLRLHTSAACAMFALGKSPAEVFDEMITVKMGPVGPTFDQLVVMYCTAIITLAQQENEEAPHGD